MKSLMEDIKNKTFRTVYLLYGEESYLKTLYKNKIKEAILPDGDTMNLNVYEGKGIVPQEIIAQADTMPFFADKRLILVENSGMFKSASQEMAEYIPSIPEETCLVFVEDQVDKRGKLYKAVNSRGRAVEMGRQDEKTLMNWILRSLRKENKNITSADMTLFLSHTGTNMELIEKELEKLLCYTMGRDQITGEDITAVCSVQTENKIFDMISAMARRQQKKALELYYDLLALKEPPMRILYLVTRQFNLLMQVKELQNHGFDGKGIADKMKMASFILKNYTQQAGNYSLEQLQQAVKDCVETEEWVKTGRMNDRLGVELLIIQYSGKQV